MINTFPPSSPVLGSAAQTDNPFYQPSSDDFQLIEAEQVAGKRRVDQLYHEHQHYPTPVASSSTGRSSSPIRTVEVAPKSGRRSSNKSFPIELDPRGCTRLAIGRKRSVCDIVLPSKKHISRQHAFITYIPQRNEVKLECNGVNGIVVVVPQQLKCRLRKADTGNSYQLLTDQFDSPDWISDKDIEKLNDITSFVLLKGESVFMPYIDGTIIDFRQAEAHLTLMNLYDETDINSTETEDEALMLLPQDADLCETTTTTTPRKFIKVPQSPPTVQAKAALHEQEPLDEPIYPPASTTYTTPSTSLLTNTPSTPKKPKKDVKIEDRERQLTPLPILRDAIPILASQPALDKIEEQHKRKQHKPNSNGNRTVAEILLSLEERGIRCKELQHVLANHLAFANVQQTPLCQLQQVNSKTSVLSRCELRALLKDERCIGIIHREGKDAAGKPLDEEYYYDLENDPDAERRNLVTALKGGRSGLRACRRTHKQYFWKKPAK
ncbi:hypothetical protein HG536_0B00790 [Torulaspora globosa]|uniref:FHA domain-containing protein n=1 Tax=Torulaspora globosa TaxID=48254 RepID=A0A7G3ZCI2_9SACH|nr:uncharacterized protein HG536_0B00790 [Torulaspora globosa]QLL31218.1 hypothetical protein HG536_0B00790 [Torulaspora globosa]